jgi:hypothetical protein
VPECEVPLSIDLSDILTPIAADAAAARKTAVSLKSIQKSRSWQ